MRLKIVIETPPSKAVASSDMVGWLRAHSPAFLGYINPEGNLEDGALVAHDGMLYIGTRPIVGMHDFSAWHAFESARPGPETETKKLWEFTLGRFVTVPSLFFQLNALINLSPGEYRRL